MDEVQRNIAMVRRLEGAFNGRNYSFLQEIIATPSKVTTLAQTT